MLTSYHRWGQGVNNNSYRKFDTVKKKKKALETDNQQDSIFTCALLPSNLRNFT